ncbi:MAG: protease modulator HflC [Immundisolibacteraceae bacterium]|nr:protease modulator HflC [Immundisolibacteraceae bacterium]
MSRINLVFGLIGLLVIGVLNTVFIVDERQKAILFKFGEIIRADYEPGLHFKLPIMNTVALFSSQIQTLDAQPVRYQTEELKNVTVDTFVKWRITDVQKFYIAIGGSDINTRLGQIVNDVARSEFGKRSVNEVVSGARVEIMEIMQKAANVAAQTYGIEVVDVRLKRVDLPLEASNSVYARMSAGRNRVAKEFRAQGAEEAEKIRAQADKEKEILLAEADRKSQIIRGSGDATAANTYASAYGANEEFYSFYRSLEAYRKVFGSGEDLMVLKPEGEFFKYFGDEISK